MVPRQAFPLLRSRPTSPGPRALRERLALLDVVRLEHLGRARKLDPDLLQQRHEALAERVELPSCGLLLAEPTYNRERLTVLAWRARNLGQKNTMQGITRC